MSPAERLATAANYLRTFPGDIDLGEILSLPLADWLDIAAEDVKRGLYRSSGASMTAALDVADAILGEDQ